MAGIKLEVGAGKVTALHNNMQSPTGIEKFNQMLEGGSFVK